MERMNEMAPLHARAPDNRKFLIERDAGCLESHTSTSDTLAPVPFDRAPSREALLREVFDAILNGMWQASVRGL